MYLQILFFWDSLVVYLKLVCEPSHNVPQSLNPKTLLEGAVGLSKLVISRFIIRVAPFRALITLLLTHLLSPLPLQVETPNRTQPAAMAALTAARVAASFAWLRNSDNPRVSGSRFGLCELRGLGFGDLGFRVRLRA